MMRCKMYVDRIDDCIDNLLGVMIRDEQGDEAAELASVVHKLRVIQKYIQADSGLSLLEVQDVSD